MIFFPECIQDRLEMTDAPKSILNKSNHGKLSMRATLNFYFKIIGVELEMKILSIIHNKKFIN